MTKAARRQFLPALEETGQPKPSFGEVPNASASRREEILSHAMTCVYTVAPYQGEPARCGGLGVRSGD
ncbi:MAG: hypothetical protein KME30_22180 [Iphinoe sp. HA4291-MV1]|jgi:hypothetical protein|nr:hypothetical protein [Iphinoe sp. HA4291-MV1]